jgi:hypothetical protein
MKRKVLILLLLANYFSPALFSQKLITLKECYDKAMSVNALSGEKDANSSISVLKDENLSKGWLPTLDANASANYVSE